MHISPDQVRVVMTGGLNLTDGEEVFARLPVTGEFSIFRSFLVESKRENNIYLTVDILNVLQAFRSLDNECSMRLTKRGSQPLLSLGLDTDTMTTVQEIPVVVAMDPRDLMEECNEPEVDNIEVKLRMPSLRVLKSIVEHMRALNSTVVLEGTVDGDFTISTSTIEVDMKTSFKGLGLRPNANRPQPASTTKPEESVASSSSSSTNDTSVPTGPGTGRSRLVLKAKKLLNVLQYRPQDVVVAFGIFAEKLCFVLHLKLFGGAAQCTYYVPVLLDQSG